MKDALILLILVGVTLYSVRQPWIGAMAWTLVSLMSPHVQYGNAAASWPVATGIAIATLLGLLATKEKQNPFIGAGSWWMLAFFIWTCITLPFSIFFDPSLDLWIRSLKIFFMLYVTMALVTNKQKLHVFIWINVIAIAFYGVKGGIFTVASGGNHRVWGPGGFIEGNNEVALAVISVVPLLRYLQTRFVKPWAITCGTIAIVLCVATALGSHSRGALLGIGAMGLFFWLKGGNKLLWGILIAAMAVGLASLMPDAWWDRMGTIKDYKTDDSAMGRINAWGMAFNLANAKIFGGGFSIWTGAVFQVYGPNPNDVHAAHSIYFQVLGEHGWIGLFIFLGIGVATWWVARDLVKLGRLRADLKWAGDLGAMIQVSVIGYGVSGAFLSLAYYDLPYNVMAIAMLARKFAQQELTQVGPVTKEDRLGSDVAQPAHERRKT